MANKTFKIGEWTYHPETLVVRYHDYEVDLEKCHTSAGMLDWIFQFASKSQATPKAIGELVEILNALLYPQGTLCSRGVERGPLPTGEAMRQQIKARVKQRDVFEQRFRARIISPADWQNQVA